MTTTASLLRLYDEQLRAEAEVSDAWDVARIDPVLAATFPDRGRGFVNYRTIPREVDVDQLVDAVVDHYASDPRVARFEWKTRGHDDVLGLHETLGRHGFAFEETETVMAGPVEAAISAGGPVPPGYSVEGA